MKLGKNISKILLVSVLLSFISAAAYGCKTEENDAGDDGTVSETAASTETQEEKLEIKNYDGYAFKILSLASIGLDFAFSTEEENGEVLNDAIFRRNMGVEEAYNVTISDISDLGDFNEVINRLRECILADSDDYDAAAGQTGWLSALISEKGLIAWDGNEYLDTDKPCWDATANESMSILKRHYLLVGDISMTYSNSTYVTFFNKKLIGDYNLEDPYKLVGDGKWTIDKTYEMARAAGDDLDGNSVMDVNDQWGLLFTAFTNQMYSAGCDFFKTNTEGIPELTMGTERFVATHQKLVDLVYNTEGVWSEGTYVSDIFKDGRGLLLHAILSNAQLFRDMTDDYGIIPIAKMDEAQEQYRSYVYYGTTGLVMPVTVSDTSRTGLILQAMCENSTDTVRAAYYDNILSYKLSRDDESVKMLDLIFATRGFDIGIMMQIGDVEMDYIYLYIDADKTKAANIVSFLAEKEYKYATALDALVEAVGN